MVKKDKQSLNNYPSEKKVEKPKSRNPFEFFFSLGDKATKGDPIRKAAFDYYLLWVMFLAFFSILISNFMNFLNTFQENFIYSLKYLGWTGVMVAIMWFQYFGLANAYRVRKATKEFRDNFKTSQDGKLDEVHIESVGDMLKEFDENSEDIEKKGGKKETQ